MASMDPQPEAANPTPTTTWSYVRITSSTNLGPMTTALQFPSDCTNIYNFRTTILGATWSTVYTGGCVMSSCCPSSRFYTTDRGWYSSYYSPAVCPQSYQTCPGPWEVASTLGTTEHVRFCCPTGYTCPLWSGFEICATQRTKPTSVLIVENISIQKVISTETLSEGSPIYDYAYPLQIRWRDSDFSISTLTSGLPAPTTPIETSSGDDNSPSFNHGLSTGSIAAIGVVISSVVIILAIAAFLLWKKKARQRHQPVPPSQHPQELDATSKEVYELGPH